MAMGRVRMETHPTHFFIADGFRPINLALGREDSIFFPLQISKVGRCRTQFLKAYNLKAGARAFTQKFIINGKLYPKTHWNRKLLK